MPFHGVQLLRALVVVLAAACSSSDGGITPTAPTAPTPVAEPNNSSLYTPQMGCTGRYWRRDDGQLSFEVRLLNSGERPADHDLFTQQYRANTSQPWTTDGSTTWPLDRDTSGFATPLFAGLSSSPFQWRARSCPRSQNDSECSSWSNVINWIASSCAAMNARGPSPPVVRPTEPPAEIPIIESEFNRYVWDHLIYSADQNDPSRQRIRIWPDVPEVRVMTVDANGDPVSSEFIEYVKSAVPGLIRTLTRRSYSRSVQETTNSSNTNIIVVTFVKRGQNFCGRVEKKNGPQVKHGATILIGLECLSRPDYVNQQLRRFKTLFQHEFGHAMGLSHVRSTDYMMHPSDSRFTPTFKKEEVDHTQFAYWLGDDKPYCKSYHECVSLK